VRQGDDARLSHSNGVLRFRWGDAWGPAVRHARV